MPHRIESIVNGIELAVVNTVTAVLVVNDIETAFQLIVMGTAIIYNLSRIFYMHSKNFKIRRRAKNIKKRNNE